jgi:hypothetical protein
MSIPQLNHRDVFFSPFNKDERFEEIKSRIRHLEGKMGVGKSVQLALNAFHKSPCAYLGQNTIKLPTWFLFKYEDIPAGFRVASLDDPRLLESHFLNELAAWMNEKFREAGLSSVIRPADHGTLQRVIGLMRDCDLYEKSRDFTLGHELAHLNHTQVKERILQALYLQESVSAAGIVGGIFLLCVALSIIPFVHLTVTLIVAGVAISVSIAAIVFWLNKATPPASISSVEEEREADMDALNTLQEARGGIHYFETLRQQNLAVRQSNPDQRRVIDENGNNLRDKKHPTLTERIAYIRHWQSQHLQTV